LPDGDHTIVRGDVEDKIKPHQLVDIDKPSLQSAIVNSIDSSVSPEVSDCPADIVCETSPSTASDTLLLLPILEKHEVPATSAGSRGDEDRKSVG